MKLIDRLKQNELNIYTTCNVLFKLLIIKVSTSSLKHEINKHVYFPSLLTVKDVLQKFGVESNAIKRNQYSLNDFEPPFIVPLQKKEWSISYFTVVKEVSEKIIEYFDPIDLVWKKESLSIFELWDKNIILLVDKQDINGEPDYKEKRKNELKSKIVNKFPLYTSLILILLSLGLGYSNQSSGFRFISGYILLILSLLGAGLSFLLSWYEVDKQNPFLREVCSGKKNINCNAVLSAERASFHGVEWSILGLCYFIGNILAILFLGINNPTVISVLLGIAILISPYIVFSLYYQYRIVRQWCILCLGVQAVIFLQLITAIFYFISNKISIGTFNPQLVVNSFLFFTGILTFGIYGFSFIKKARVGKMYERKWKRLKANPHIFKSLLSQQPKIKNYPSHLGVSLGSPDAATEIIKVCNPYCGPCSESHPILEDIIRNNNDVKLRIIFTAEDKEEDIKAQPVKHFMALSDVKSSYEMQEVMDDWYVNDEIQKDYQRFADKYPLNEELDRQGSKLSAMKSWCDEMNIRATPTIFINGYELMDTYSIKELKDILND